MTHTLRARLSADTLGRLILLGLLVVFIGIVSWGMTHHAQANGGYYAMVMTFPESGVDSEENYGETFAPCQSTGNCNFSCNASNAGRSCSNLVCTGTGNGESAGFYTHEYTCEYFPPTCTADSSCASNTCSTDTCTATASDCSTYQIAGTKSCSVPCTVTNACGDSASGTLVNGVCSASAPPAVDQCPSDPGLQCSTSQCSAPPPYAQGYYEGSYVPYSQSYYQSYYEGSYGGGGGGGCTGTGAVTVSASPSTRVRPGGSVTVSWSDTDASGATCTVTDGSGATIKTSPVSSCSVSDSTTLTNIQNQTTLTVTCGGQKGTIVVNVLAKYKEF